MRKLVSIKRYIVYVPTVLMIVTAIIMLVMIHLLSDAAVTYDIKQDLRRNVLRNQAYVAIEDGKLEITKDFLYEDDYSTYVVIEKNGNVLAGSYPKEVESTLMKMKAKQENVRKVMKNGEKYYVKDLRVSRWNGTPVFVRGIVKKSDAYSVYRTIERISMLCILGVFLALFIFQYVFAKQISKELKGMCETAEVIGRNMDVTKRIDYDGRFQEIAVLVEANNRMLERIEQSLRMQEQFSSDVAHELRTPVAVMLAECQYAESRLEVQEEVRETLDVMHRQSKKINDIISRLLDFSRLEQEDIQIRLDEIDLSNLAEVLCKEEQEKAGDHVTIRTDLKKAVIMGDVNLISIVIRNLLNNAVKFSPEKGIIEISTGKKEDAVYLSVRDYGIGMEQQEVDRIFQRFYKCEKSRNEEAFGLGLPLSMKIVKKHGGTITVESEKHKGSTFTVYFSKKK